MELFAQRLRELRTEHSLTQKQLSDILNYTQSNISEWEKGTVEPKATALTSIAKLFNVSIDYLLGLEDDFERDISHQINISPITLSSEEMEILNLFHSMSHAQRLRFAAYGEGLIENPGKKKA